MVQGRPQRVLRREHGCARRAVPDRCRRRQADAAHRRTSCGAELVIFGGWGDYVQVLTAKGYAVLHPNYRGSTGTGDAFTRDMVGHYFKNAHLDVMAGVDKTIAMGIADPTRLVKMGWSGGGHMTNKLI